MTATYFFFGHLCVFWAFFTQVRGTLELCRKTSAMETSDAFAFFAFTEKNVGELLLALLLAESYYWEKLSIQSINEFLENRDQDSLDIRSFFACNISLLTIEVDNCSHNYQTWAANKSLK